MNEKLPKILIWIFITGGSFILGFDFKNQGEINFRQRIEPPNITQKTFDPHWMIWGASVIPYQGKYYAFIARWPMDKGYKGWMHFSQIVVGVSEKPEGPFNIIRELDELYNQSWSAKSVHNPHAQILDGKLVLFYIGNTYNQVEVNVNQSEARYNQRIGVAFADHPHGPWTPSQNNPVLEPRADKWDSTFVTNPAVYKAKDGLYRMIYKAETGDLPAAIKQYREKGLVLGLAKAENLEGPWYGRTDRPNFPLNGTAEDPNVWQENDYYFMLAKAFDDTYVPRHEGVLFTSNNGIDWQVAQNPLGYDHSIHWQDSASVKYKRVERPYVLTENGRAKAFFTAVWTGVEGEPSFNLGRKVKSN